MSLRPRCTITPVTPVMVATSRSKRAAPDGPQKSCSRRPQPIPWLITAMRGRGGYGFQARRQQIGPRVIAVDRGTGSLRDGIAERHERADGLRRQHFDRPTGSKWRVWASHPRDPPNW